MYIGVLGVRARAAFAAFRGLRMPAIAPRRMQLFILLSVAHAALVARPSALPNLQRLRGGAAATEQKPRVDPGPSPQFVAQVVSWAALPTALRLAYAALTLKPLPPPPLESSSWFGAATTTAAAPVSLPFPQGWQVRLALAWVANNLAVRIPGRYDGQSLMAKEAKPTVETANLFAPAGWAFAIWAPIFVGEWLMMLYLTNVPAAAELAHGRLRHRDSLELVGIVLHNLALAEQRRSRSRHLTSGERDDRGENRDCAHHRRHEIGLAS